MWIIDWWRNRRIRREAKEIQRAVAGLNQGLSDALSGRWQPPLEQAVERAKKEVATLREGKMYLTGYDDMYIRKAVALGISYEILGTSAAEVELLVRLGGTYKNAASKLLTKARNDPSFVFSSLTDLAKKGGFTLADIGTNESELKAIDHLFEVQLCRRGLDDLRRWSAGCRSPAASDLDFLCEDVQKQMTEGQIGWEELEISEAEFLELRRLAHEQEARDRLKIFRDYAEIGHAHDRPDLLQNLEKHLMSANLTLENIGSSVEEITTLRLLSWRVHARNRLIKLREPDADWFFGISRPGFPVYDPDEEEAALREEVSKSKATLSDLGVSEDELAEILVRAHKFRAEYLLNHLRQLANTPRRTIGGIVGSVLSHAQGRKGLAQLLHSSIVQPGVATALAQREENYQNTDRDLQAIRLSASRLGVSLAQLGTSEDELSELVSKIAQR